MLYSVGKLFNYFQWVFIKLNKIFERHLDHHVIGATMLVIRTVVIETFLIMKLVTMILAVQDVNRIARFLSASIEQATSY